MRRSGLITLISALWLPLVALPAVRAGEPAASPAPPADPALLEFLGSVDSDEPAWREYSADATISALARASCAAPCAVSSDDPVYAPRAARASQPSSSHPANASVATSSTSSPPVAPARSGASAARTAAPAAKPAASAPLSAASKPSAANAGPNTGADTGTPAGPTTAAAPGGGSP